VLSCSLLGATSRALIISIIISMLRFKGPKLVILVFYLSAYLYVVFISA
jgi:hypothetical protein